MNFNRTLVIGLLLALSTRGYAELRILGVRVTKGGKSELRVSIYSDVKEEDKRDLKLDQAVAILSAAKGWGSSVLVGIEAHAVRPAEYLPLVKDIADNIWLDLVFIEARKPDFIVDNIKKRMESDAATKGRPGPEK